MGGTRKTGRGFGTDSMFCHLDKTEVGRKRKIVKCKQFSFFLQPTPRHSAKAPPVRHRFHNILPTHHLPATLNTRFHIDDNERARTKTVDDRAQVEEVVGAQSTTERGSRSATDKGERGQRKVRANHGSLTRTDRSLTLISLV